MSGFWQLISWNDPNPHHQSLLENHVFVKYLNNSYDIVVGWIGK